MTSSGSNRTSAATGRFLSGLALISAASVVLIGCSPSMPSASMPTTATTSMPAIHDQPASASPMVVSAPVEGGTGPDVTPVYYLGANPRNVYLYREFRRDLPDMGDPISTAVKAMTSTGPDDPDYFSPWTPASKIGASISGKNVITVDISADAFRTSLDEGMAHRAVQQLVYTATAAAASSGLITSGRPSSVVILVDGHAGYKAFGHVELGGEMTRDTTVAAPIWVIDPQEDASLTDSVSVFGSGVAADSTLQWTVSRLEDTESETGAPAESASVVASGTVQLDSHPGETGKFRFSLPLPPGNYELRVFHRAPGNAAPGSGSASGGTDAGTKTGDAAVTEANPDSKRFTID